MSKRKLFFDMDGVLVDFQSGIDKLSDETKREYEGRLDEVPGIFSLMDPMPGAIDAVKLLSEHYDVYILSTAPWKNTSAWSDKITWITKHFGELFKKRVILTHCKNLCYGDFLVDDRGKNGASEFTGEWIEFGSALYPGWEDVGFDELVERLINIAFERKRDSSFKTTSYKENIFNYSLGGAKGAKGAKR